MQIAAKEIARMLGGTLEGDGEVLVSKPGKIEQGGPGTLTFLANPRYEHFAYTTPAAAVLVPRDFSPTQKVAAAALIRVDDVYNSLRILMEKFGGQMQSESGISDRAFVHPTAILGDAVSVGMFSVVEEGTTVAGGTTIHPQVFVGKNVTVGRNCTIYPGVKIYHDCVIGDNCILHSNVVIGSDGFGFVPQTDGRFLKLPQLGNVVVEADVEIGANTTIDRATMGSTFIRQGVKLDNLVMVAHNVDLGEHTVVAAQAGFAGSTKIGKNCRIGGQAGFVGHIEVADGTQVQAQSGVAASVKQTGTALYGSPAIPYSDYLRSYAVFKKLPAIYKKLNELIKKG
ncbi:MAG: UDP-3-O-(3-hydroxymyristoyl)glucosamine N-acyltransferase [Saprospiraceae bacterium]|nr:UDP-3-O-(3-hydroxymyristoyl)glucosamine N-acyltransferase [Saprospiraceae bacterium]MCF8252220.1 UDP-3-O-(3-hydroxymyristoyl)glucosamine N-acyltransferase [Saprospiraceae bacterium]MCF8282018.1 UDP-3-O-(3-hydroxymyristoyl)glucosamine N-acyltransferase [Bacteroidales bacterium]MCF8311676.1 UDP-3-O-(3-hydroxymyristoyl)glucosamine N-acyltransferase [Saprospiraceae bacterium]MCF8442595.1 UDP-3-O-(3-hydroxymyristoyl)glucosamine N-acyltransferase [Saprospiraceae bacterium]